VPPRSAGSTGRGSRFEPRRDGVAHHRVVQPVRPARNPTPPGRGRVARGALGVSRGSGAEGRGLARLAALRAPRRSSGSTRTASRTPSHARTGRLPASRSQGFGRAAGLSRGHGVARTGGDRRLYFVFRCHMGRTTASVSNDPSRNRSRQLGAVTSRLSPSPNETPTHILAPARSSSGCCMRNPSRHSSARPAACVTHSTTSTRCRFPSGQMT